MNNLKLVEHLKHDSKDFLKIYIYILLQLFTIHLQLHIIQSIRNL
jgi:hypothetical protein